LAPKGVQHDQPRLKIMFETALARFGGTAATTIMIGDNPVTDVFDAKRSQLAD
jgi:ribonucleotide monophosphatase NagD (HAD superfamily)